MKKRLSVLILAAALLVSALSVSGCQSEEKYNIADARDGVVRIIAVDEFGDICTVGSAFAVGPVWGEASQYFVTNRHCLTIEGVEEVKASKVYILLDDSALTWRTYDALETEEEGAPYFLNFDSDRAVECDIKYYNDSTEYPDVAVIKAIEPITSRAASALRIRVMADDEIGRQVYALGYPGDSDIANISYDRSAYLAGTTNGRYVAAADQSTMTSGTISRRTRFEQYLNTVCIQHDAQINSGNSGGPLLDENGYVIGINAYSYNLDSYAVDIQYVVDIFRTEWNIDICENEEVSPFAEYIREHLPIVAGGIVLLLIVAGAVIFVLNAQAKSRKEQEVKIRELEEQQERLRRETGRRAREAEEKLKAAGVPVIQSLASQHQGRKIQLTDGQILLGRNRECGLVYADKTPGVSKVHCSLYWDAGNQEFVLTDMKSTYGTYLPNGEKLVPGKSYRLKPGESFWLGERENRIQLSLG